MHRITTHSIRIAAGVLAGALLLAGCSDSAGDPSAGSATTSASSVEESAAFNNADVTFVQGMIPHHRGALAMARLADGRAEDPRVMDLARRIEAAQDPEIQTMTGWLEDWGEPLPEESESMSGMDDGSGGMAMEGMSDEDMAALEGVSGAEFDRMFLEMMIEHHRGAVDMARTEVSDGSNPDAIDLARQIVDSQSAEIDEMDQLLGELSG